MPRDAAELLLSYSEDGKSLDDGVSRLFEAYHGIKGILRDGADGLGKAADLKESALCFFDMQYELFKAVSSVKAACAFITDAHSACEYFKEVYKGVRVEQFKVACLYSNGLVFDLINIGNGTTFGVGFDAGDLKRLIVRSGCKRCILSHNHPGGSCLPSAADISTTDIVCRTLESEGVAVLDHIICGRDGVRGMLTEYGIIDR